MKKPLREKGNEKENKVKQKEKGLLSKNLYTIQESEKPYCTVKEKLSRGHNFNKTKLQV